jgi:putative phosphonate metabolism protein
MRYAFYFSPDPGTDLARLGENWLGRSARSGRTLQHPDLDGLPARELAAITGPARRYGFHGTLKAPFRLADGVNESELVAAMERFAAETPAFEIPSLTVGLLDHFVALVPEGRADRLNAFANGVVESFEPFRAALTESEIKRRNPDGLASAELKNLVRWGYPYVFDRFRFHMTLSNRLSQEDAPRILNAARAYFAPALAQPVPVDALTLFIEPEPGAPFQIHSWAALAPGTQRKTA